MYYQFTGQPGHGKTVLALDFALEMKRKADERHAENPAKHPYRELYVCNVRDFNAGKAGAIELSPQQLRDWHERPEFDHAIILVDEAYEHGMFPKRGPGAKVPEHVQQVAKHRHRGIDFIMICQSPTRQMDDFLHDLIEEHYHIRRRFGLPLVDMKRWDRFERNPDKGEPLTRTKRRYPVKIFKLYTSTKYDTAEKRVPWFYYAAAAMLVFVVVMGVYMSGRIKTQFGKNAAHQATLAGNGAPATVPAGGRLEAKAEIAKPEDYAAKFTPLIDGVPWSAPAWANDQVRSEPHVYCIASGPDGREGCHCTTEQGTRVRMDLAQCWTLARYGEPYNPFKAPERAREPHQVDQAQAVPVAARGAVGTGDPVLVQPQGGFARIEPVMPAEDAHF